MVGLDLAFKLIFISAFIVFIALILLSFIIYLFSKIRFNRNINSSSSSDLFIDKASNSVLSNENLDEELIAVLTIAISLYVNKKPNYKFKIKSFKRIKNSAPIWNTVGRNEYIANKL